MPGGPYDDLDRPSLDPRGLSRALVVDGSLWSEIRVVAQTASTNADLVAAAHDGAPCGVVLVAESQTAGRGRLDRVWVAPARSGLTMSVLLRPAVDASRWGWLPLLAGLSVVDAVRSVADVSATLKWPNDVQVDGRKLAGLLVEKVNDSGTPAAVVGIGLNISLRADERPVPDATSLLLEGASTVDRAVVLKALLRMLGGRMSTWEEARGDVVRSGLVDDYRAVCSTLGRDVRVETPDGSTIEGRAQGVDDDGRLLVISDQGRHLVLAGEVVHLRPA